MKKTICAVCAAAFITTGTFAQAGSLADPVVEAPIIVADATSSSSGTALVAMLALLMILPVVTD